MIEIIDLNKPKQQECRVMICQFNASEFLWSEESELHFLRTNDRIASLLKVARDNSVELVVFPELSIPENAIGKIQQWSKDQHSTVICGSHYYQTNEGYISRCPIIINGEVYFTEKVTPSPYEIAPVNGLGLQPGTKTLKFKNTGIGDFAVLICADYLNERLKYELDFNSLDFLLVPAFQNDSNMYYSRMQQDVNASYSGLYVLYSNFLGLPNGDGRSAVFGVMDRIFSSKLKNQQMSDGNPEEKLYEFPTAMPFIIADFNLAEKRPRLGRNIHSKPNVKFELVHQLNVSDQRFVSRIAHDDERYRRIDELYVPPQEFKAILSALEKQNIVFIIGDPGIGKTYTAAKLLKHYFQKGYDPIWFAGLEKEDREIQQKALSDYVPANKQIVYFEDPFGRTTFERKDSLFQVFSPLIEQLSKLDCKIIITSRKEIFEHFTEESLMEDEILNLKKELNVRNPSYQPSELIEIFSKLAEFKTDWFDQVEFVNVVRQAIYSHQLTTPLAIRDLVYATRDITSAAALKESIDRREKETIKVFALEIKERGFSTKLALLLVMFGGYSGKSELVETYSKLSRRLSDLNYKIDTFSFNTEIRSQISYRVELIGDVKSVYRLSHPVYEEALAFLIESDRACTDIAKLIISEIAALDPRLGYAQINRFVVKYPKMSQLLFTSLLDNNQLPDEEPILVTLASKLIATFTSTGLIAYFDLAVRSFSLKKAITRLNDAQNRTKNVLQLVILIQRYVSNSPKGFDRSAVGQINWAGMFSLELDLFKNPHKIVMLFQYLLVVSPQAVQIFIDKKGITYIKRMYLMSDKSYRKQFRKAVETLPVYSSLEIYETQLLKMDENSVATRSRMLRDVILSSRQYQGIITLDDGAVNVLKQRWINLLPAGITAVEGDFSAGDVIAMFTKKGQLIAVGVTEYGADDLRLLKGHSSPEFQAIIGYFHTACAIRHEYMLKFTYRMEIERDQWVYRP